MMNAKRIRTIICITAIATMLFSSMGIGAFATVEQNTPDVQAQGEVESTDAEEPVVEAPQADETPAVVEEETAPAEEAAAPEVEAKADTEGPTYAFTQAARITKTLSGHQRVKVFWTPAKATITKEVEPTPVDPEEGEGIGEGTGTGEGGEGTGEEPTPEPTTVTEDYPVGQYIVQRAPQGGGYSNYCTINMNENGTVKNLTGNAVSGSYKTSPYWTKEAATAGVSGGALYFEDKDVGDGLMDNATKKYRGGVFTYRIIPVIVKEDGDLQQGSVSNAVGDACMRTSYVALKIKVKKNLTSHDKQHKKLSLKKGSTIYTCAFGYGRYQFIHNGNLYWLNRVGTKSHKSGYDKGHPYSNEEILYFVNGRSDGIAASATKKLVWVNTYTQRIFVFSGSSGKWTLDNSGGWYVSTGKAATPTIRYMDPKSPILDSGRIVGKFKTINKKVKKRHGIPCWNCFSTWNAIHGQKKSWSIKGVPKSNGCVRNTNGHATYIYNNCPKKTRVLIF